MSLITVDFETFYDSKIKLGFKHQTTEEYIRDKRFEVVGVGVQVDDGAPVWFSGTKSEIKSSYTSTTGVRRPCCATTRCSMEQFLAGYLM